MSEIITLYEQPNFFALKYIIDNWGKIEFKRKLWKSKESIFIDCKKYLGKQRYGRTEIKYKKTGASEYGRYFVTNNCVGLQGLCREVRNTITFNNYYDIDIVNAQPTLLYKYCINNNYPYENLKKYVLNRETYLDDLIKENNIDRDTAKQEILKFINGGKSIEQLIINEDLQNLLNEIIIIQEKVKIDNSNLVKYAKKKKIEKYNAIWNIEGSVLNYILTRLENEAIMCIIKYFKTNNIDIDTIIHDGILIKKKHFKDLNDLNNKIQECELFVKETIKYDIKIKEKPMFNMLDIPQEIAIRDIQKEKQEKENKYTFLKEEIEKAVCKIKNPSTFIEIDNDGVVFYKTEKQIIETWKTWKESEGYYSNEKTGTDKEKPFIYNWINDFDILTYNKVDFIPKGEICPSYIFNLFKGLYVDNCLREVMIDYDEKDTNLQTILKHIFLMVGNDDKSFKYFINWLANLFIEPAIIPRTSVIIKTVEGVGKNFFLDWIGMLLGENYYTSISDANNRIFSRFNNERANKLLINLDEANAKDTEKFYEVLKSEISNKNSKIEQKGVDVQTIKNFTRWIFTTNNELPVHISSSDRRFVLFECKEKKPSQSYFKKLSKCFNNKETQKQFYMFLHKHYKKNYDWIGERPKTEFYKRSVESCIDNTFTFINTLLQRLAEDEQGGQLKINTKVFYDKYASYCKESNLDINSKTVFNNKIREIEGIKKVNGRSTTYYKINSFEVKKWLENKNLLEDNIGYDSDDNDDIGDEMF